MTVLGYIKNFLIAIDQLLNVVLLGSPDETLSSRAYRAWNKERIFGKIFKPLIDMIFFWDFQHCLSAYESELKKRQFPPEFWEV